MVTQNSSRSAFENNKPKYFESTLYSFLFVYFRVLEVAGDRAKGDAAQQGFGG